MKPSRAEKRVCCSRKCYAKWIAKIQKERWDDPNLGKQLRKEISERNLGDKSHFWRGGVSFYPYCQKFNNPLKESNRNIFHNKCALCGKTREENRRELGVHHVFTEKMACCETKIEEMELLRARLPPEVAQFGEPEFSDVEIIYIRMMVPLCNTCHGKMNSKTETLPYYETTYRKFFAELIMNEYGGICYETHSLTEVLS